MLGCFDVSVMGCRDGRVEFGVFLVHCAVGVCPVRKHPVERLGVAGLSESVIDFNDSAVSQLEIVGLAKPRDKAVIVPRCGAVQKRCGADPNLVDAAVVWRVRVREKNCTVAPPTSPSDHVAWAQAPESERF